MQYNSWSKEEVALLRKMWATTTASQIAKMLGKGRTKDSVIGKVHSLGLPNKRPLRPQARAGRSA